MCILEIDVVVNCVTTKTETVKVVRENLVTVENSYLTRMNKLRVTNVNTSTKHL